MKPDDKCDRCGFTHNLEVHHIVYRVEGGKDEKENLVTLCRSCHDYRHAKEAVEKAIKSEEKRLEVLKRRLELIEGENSVESIRARGYQTYWTIFNDKLPRVEGCHKSD